VFAAGASAKSHLIHAAIASFFGAIGSSTRPGIGSGYPLQACRPRRGIGKAFRYYPAAIGQQCMSGPCAATLLALWLSFRPKKTAKASAPTEGVFRVNCFGFLANEHTKAAVS
jgi:hypothetical protein